MSGQHVALGSLERRLLPLYRRWLNDFAMLHLIDHQLRPLTPDWIEQWYDRHTRATDDTMMFTMWKVDGWVPVGNCAFQHIDYRNRTAEFGIFLGDA